MIIKSHLLFVLSLIVFGCGIGIFSIGFTEFSVDTYDEVIIEEVIFPWNEDLNISHYYDINYKYCLIGLLICYIYACSDEVHQLFVPGRSGKIIDTFVDLVGSSIGVFSYYLIRKKCKN